MLYGNSQRRNQVGLNLSAMLVLLLCLLVLLIPGGITAEFELIGSPDPIGAVAGDDVILPCTLEPPINAEFLTVVWSVCDQKCIPNLVHLYREGRNLNAGKNPSYKDRTMLFEEELVKGNVSLKLFGVKLEDEGSYTCRAVKTGVGVDSQEETVIHLSVGMVSIPDVSILGVNDTGMVLQCVAKSWYPEPELEWRESEGQLLHADVTQTDKDPDGRYTVRSKVTVQKTDTNMFTCRVELQGLNQTRETEIHIPDQLYLLKGASYDSIVPTIAIVAGNMAIFIGVAVFCYFQKKRTSSGKHVDHDEPQSSAQMLPGKEDEPHGQDVSVLPGSQVNEDDGSDSGACTDSDEDGDVVKKVTDSRLV
ncbi:butyrophilin subfamily 1 member A1-like isoform X3 [Hypomesus transpacificus]|uniref:butyrophilin subfamily 1 member A1-like isoform X3 n=1 Tax=Hypomesus transpacificus TaxID=137520 RepID=UPI001F07E72B|nr:butyrophilin subfamily 1 member A1-like isoform X3 [Hypomesus transpacificus]